MTKLRVYSEMLPLPDLAKPATLALLSRYGLSLVLAVRPWDEPLLPDVARALRDVGVPLAIWPMLADDAGRWASMHNAAEFCRFALSVCDVLEGAGARPSEVLFDLEPPFATARTLAQAAAGASAQAELGRRDEHTRPIAGVARLAFALGGASPAFEQASRTLAHTVEEIHARGIGTSMAVWPLVALDPPGDDGWQSLLGTPVDALGTGHVSVMMYTSILEGWSRGVLRRRHTSALLMSAAARAVRRWGGRAGISIGCVGPGAFGDEPTYRDAADLAEDAALVRAAGCDRLTLFDLAGVLSRSPAEAWLEAFVSGAERPEGPEARDVPSSRRVEVVRSVARAATHALVPLRRLRRRA